MKAIHCMMVPNYMFCKHDSWYVYTKVPFKLKYKLDDISIEKFAYFTFHKPEWLSDLLFNELHKQKIFSSGIFKRLFILDKKLFSLTLDLDGRYFLHECNEYGYTIKECSCKA